MSRVLSREVRVGVTLSLPPELVRQLNAYCNKFHVSRSQVGEVAVRKFLLGEAQKEMNDGNPE